MKWGICFEEEFSTPLYDVRKVEYSDRFSLEEEIVRRNQSDTDEENFLEGLLETTPVDHKTVENMMKQLSKIKKTIRTD